MVFESGWTIAKDFHHASDELRKDLLEHHG